VIALNSVILLISSWKNGVQKAQDFESAEHGETSSTSLTTTQAREGLYLVATLSLA
jgi:hypothetical protein